MPTENALSVFIRYPSRKKILHYLAQEKSSKEIAEALFISRTLQKPIEDICWSEPITLIPLVSVTFARLVGLL